MNIKKALQKIQTDGIGGYIKHIYSRKKLQQQKKYLHAQYAADWRALKGTFKGQRAFLIGNGPSLNITPLYLLKHEHVLCFNRFNIFLERLGYIPPMYMVADGLVANDMAAEINEMSGKVKYSFLTRFSLQGLDFATFINERANIHWMLPADITSGFEHELPDVNVGGSVAIAGLQVLRYLGFSDIYILGIDMNYKVHETAKVIKGKDIQSENDDDPNHFDPRYFGAGRKYHQPDATIVNTILNSFEQIGITFKRLGTNIYNSTVGGKVEYFKRVPITEVLNLEQSEVTKLFDALLVEKSGFDHRHFLILSDEEKGKEELSKSVILVDTADCLKMNDKLIYTHLPLGPYDGRVFYINRSLLK